MRITYKPKAGAKKRAAPKAKPSPARKPKARTKAAAAGKTARVHKGGRSPKLTNVALVIEHLKAAGGIRSVAAERLNVGRTTLHKFMGEHPEIAESLEEIEAEIGDLTEAQIITLIRKGDPQTVRWYAEMKLKNRGYVRRVENTGKDGGPVETRQAPDLSIYTEEELEVLAAGARRRESEASGK